MVALSTKATPSAQGFPRAVS
ncbi:rCG23784, partial [Rattus norvegicus]